MKKQLGSWSGMRKYLEQEILADSLKGRLRYGCTAYAGMDGCHIFEVVIDGTQVKRFSWETVNSYFIAQGFKEHSGNYWDDFWALLAQYPPETRTEYTDEEFCHALASYRGQSIQDSIHSENPLIRMFAILDRRLGKRSLLYCAAAIDAQPHWLQPFYRLRLEAEHLPHSTAET